MKQTFLAVMSLIFYSFGTAQTIEFVGTPSIVAPGIVSSEKSEVKLTISKDGKLMLWGAIGREGGAGGFDIWQSTNSDTGWSQPQPASVNSFENDFDPSFSADGKLLYFFSNRPGGYGGDDLYVATYDSATRSFGAPVNMGDQFNSKGDEWGPTESIDGKKILFCTDGRGGKGQHDIFQCDRLPTGWSQPRNLAEINSELDDFDPVFLHDTATVIFSRKMTEDEVLLFVSYEGTSGYLQPSVITDSVINVPNMWNFGSSIIPTEKNILYYSSKHAARSVGRLDIYSIVYKWR